jgi:hypothetical protein
MFFNFFFLFFSENDVALVIKYNFNQEFPVENESKKRKIFEPKRTENLIDYSFVKLPAKIFIHYLETDSLHFVNDCLR